MEVEPDDLGVSITAWSFCLFLNWPLRASVSPPVNHDHCTFFRGWGRDFVGLWEAGMENSDAALSKYSQPPLFLL